MMNYIDLLRKLQIKREIKEFLITDSVQHRPDLISYKIYDTVDYYPILLIFNHIDNIYTQLNTGDIIYYPDIQDIEEYVFNEKIKEIGENK